MEAKLEISTEIFQCAECTLYFNAGSEIYILSADGKTTTLCLECGEQFALLSPQEQEVKFHNYTSEL